MFLVGRNLPVGVGCCVREKRISRYYYDNEDVRTPALDGPASAFRLARPDSIVQSFASH